MSAVDVAALSALYLPPKLDIRTIRVPAPAPSISLLAPFRPILRMSVHRSIALKICRAAS